MVSRKKRCRGVARKKERKKQSAKVWRFWRQDSRDELSRVRMSRTVHHQRWDFISALGDKTSILLLY